MRISAFLASQTQLHTYFNEHAKIISVEEDDRSTRFEPLVKLLYGNHWVLDEVQDMADQYNVHRVLGSHPLGDGIIYQRHLAKEIIVQLCHHFHENIETFQ